MGDRFAIEIPLPFGSGLNRAVTGHYGIVLRFVADPLSTPDFIDEKDVEMLAESGVHRPVGAFWGAATLAELISARLRDGGYRLVIEEPARWVPADGLRPTRCPTCTSTHPAAPHTGRFWPDTPDRHGPCPDSWHTRPAGNPEETTT